MDEIESYPLDEFASFELQEDPEKDEFTIILKGRMKYSMLVASKVGGVRITEADMDEYVADRPRRK